MGSSSARGIERMPLNSAMQRQLCSSALCYSLTSLGTFFFPIWILLTIFISASYVTVNESKLLSDTFTQAYPALGRWEHLSFTGIIGAIPASAGVALGYHNKGS